MKSSTDFRATSFLVNTNLQQQKTRFGISTEAGLLFTSATR